MVRESVLSSNSHNSEFDDDRHLPQSCHLRSTIFPHFRPLHNPTSGRLIIETLEVAQCPLSVKADIGAGLTEVAMGHEQTLTAGG